MRILIAAVLAALCIASPAAASTASVTRSGYTVTLTGPDTAKVGQVTTYTATCGGAPCAYGEFRVFGGTINRLGEGFGRGALGYYTFQAAGAYQVRYRLGMTCGRQACPIDVFLAQTVVARDVAIPTT